MDLLIECGETLILLIEKDLEASIYLYNQDLTSKSTDCKDFLWIGDRPSWISLTILLVQEFPNEEQFKLF